MEEKTLLIRSKLNLIYILTCDKCQLNFNKRMNICSLQASVVHYIWSAQYDDLCTSLSHDRTSVKKLFANDTMI